MSIRLFLVDHVLDIKMQCIPAFHIPNNHHASHRWNAGTIINTISTTTSVVVVVDSVETIEHEPSLTERSTYTTY